MIYEKESPTKKKWCENLLKCSVLESSVTLINTLTKICKIVPHVIILIYEGFQISPLLLSKGFSAPLM